MSTCSIWMRRSRGWRHSMPARVNLPSCASSGDCHSKRLARHSGSRLPPPSGTGRQPGRGCSRSSGVSDDMTPERWRQITEIFHTARACDESVRASYLDRACIGDLALRKEVDAMLAADSAGAHFGEDPVNASAVHLSRLASGAMIGAYRIVELIGKGGMAEVYRARDTKLGRDVAIKILPHALTTDPDRLARFEREARVLAALNHPNIATIHGIEESGGVQGIVMELVEGETLAERIHRGRLTVPDTVSTARQIIDALDAAHEKGIVHRDLKPANIKITTAGVVKVLDFGLAKLDPRGVPETGALSQSPTVTIGGTREGVIAGTLTYMSPEQARGTEVDKRTDIWAFGCVLYEMLTGRVAFDGKTASDAIAAILEHEPDWAALPTATPLHIHRPLRRCLEKDPRRRLHDIADARIDLDDTTDSLGAPQSSVVAARGRFRWLAWSVGVASLIAVLYFAAPYLRPPREAGRPVRLSIVLPDDVT